MGLKGIQTPEDRGACRPCGCCSAVVIVLNSVKRIYKPKGLKGICSFRDAGGGITPLESYRSVGTNIVDTKDRVEGNDGPLPHRDKGT